MVLFWLVAALLAGCGSLQQASLIALNGNLYGTTMSGGAHGYGTVFSLKP